MRECSVESESRHSQQRLTQRQQRAHRLLTALSTLAHLHTQSSKSFPELEQIWEWVIDTASLNFCSSESYVNPHLFSIENIKNNSHFQCIFSSIYNHTYYQNLKLNINKCWSTERHCCWHKMLQRHSNDSKYTIIACCIIAVNRGLYLPRLLFICNRLRDGLVFLISPVSQFHYLGFVR